MYEYELDEPTKPTKEELEVTETEEMTEDDPTMLRVPFSNN